MAGDRISGTSPFVIRVQLEVSEPDDLAVFVQCYDSDHQPVFSTASFFEKELNGRNLERGCHLFECVIPGNLLNDGIYVMDANLIRNRQSITHSEKSVMSFRVHDDFSIPDGWNWRPVGVIRPDVKWTIVQVRRRTAKFDETDRSSEHFIYPQNVDCA